MSHYATKAELQEDAASWVWHAVAESVRPPVNIGQVVNTPTWSDFDAITPDGNRVVVRVELKD